METVDKLVPRAVDKCQLRYIDNVLKKTAAPHMYIQCAPPRQTRCSTVLSESDLKKGNIQNPRFCCSSSPRYVHEKLEWRRWHSISSDAKSDNFSKHGSHHSYEWFNTRGQRSLYPSEDWRLTTIHPFNACYPTVLGYCSNRLTVTLHHHIDDVGSWTTEMLRRFKVQLKLQ